MKYDQYISLIRDLEKSAASNKRWYETRVLLLTMLGYGYFVGLILLLIAPIAVVAVGLWFAPGEIWRQVLVLVKFWWIIVPGLGVYFGFLGSAIKSITARVPDPEGTEISRTEAPELFAFVYTVCKELKAKRPKQILVDDSFNAAVVTMPRFGIFGRKVILLLGLPLMKALSPRQFEAVLAHEIGHISGKHGVFAKWAYQMREAWGRLIESQEVAEHKFSSLYQKFVDWFFPYFTAYSFVLMREHEKEADREAAKLVGKRELGESLILLETKGRSLNEDFWAAVHEENVSSDTPSKQIFSRMIASLSFVNPDRSKVSLEKAVAVATDFNDTHPSLAERLRQIGYWTEGDLPMLPEQADDDAATVFFGSLGDRLTSQFDESWDEQAERTWKERHEHFQEAQKRVDELEKKRVAEDLTLEELREIARLTTEKDGIAAAMPIIEETAKRFPDEAIALYNLGSGRLSLDDESGLADLEKAGELDKSVKYDAYQIAFDYLRSKGRLDEASRYVAFLEEQNEVYEKANEERKWAQPGDDFEKHDLTADFVDSIPKKLAGLEEITAIYAANKVVKYLPEFPYRVLFIELRGKRRGDSDPDSILKIVVDRLDTGEIHFFALLNAKWGSTGKFISEIPGAKVYENSTNV